MDWRKHLEPYFSDFAPSIRDSVLDSLIKNIPPTPTLESQQDLFNALTELMPDVVNQLKLSICVTLQDTFNALPVSMDSTQLIQGQKIALNMLSGKEVDFGPEQTSVLTDGFSSTGKVIDHEVLLIEFNSDLIYELWKYFRLNDETCKTLFPKNQHLTLNANSEDIKKYLPIYNSIERIFSKIIKLEKACITLCDMKSYSMITKSSDTFLVKEGTMTLEQDLEFDMNCVMVYLFDCSQ